MSRAGVGAVALLVAGGGALIYRGFADAESGGERVALGAVAGSAAGLMWLLLARRRGGVPRLPAAVPAGAGVIPFPRAA